MVVLAEVLLSRSQFHIQKCLFKGKHIAPSSVIEMIHYQIPKKWCHIGGSVLVSVVCSLENSVVSLARFRLGKGKLMLYLSLISTSVGMTTLYINALNSPRGVRETSWLTSTEQCYLMHIESLFFFQWIDCRQHSPQKFCIHSESSSFISFPQISLSPNFSFILSKP